MIQNSALTTSCCGGRARCICAWRWSGLRDRFGVNVKSQAPRSAIRNHPQVVSQRGRHKKQSGGHGQFGDVVLEITPMPRGSGFEFRRSGRRRGARNYIGAWKRASSMG